MKATNCWKNLIRGSHLIPLLLLPLCLFGPPTVVLADTPVSGPIVGQTWTSNNSPYVVVGNILVATLTIQPGVTVQFASNYVFEVAGVLTAVGTSNTPIVFTCTNAAVGWNSIFFNGSSLGSELGFCRIEQSKNSGVRINNTTVGIHDCTFVGNSASSGGGLSLTGTGDLVLNRCTFTNNSASVYGGGLYMNATGVALFSDCFFQNNTTSGSGRIGGGGAHVNGTGKAVMQHCLFTGNSVSTDSDSEGGGAVFNRALTATSCMFIGNGVYGYYYNDGALYAGGLSADSAWLFNTTVAYNFLSLDGGLSKKSILYGAGIACGYLELKNSLIASNAFYANRTIDPRGAGVLSWGAPASIVNDTIAYNSHQGFYLYQDPGGIVDIRNCIFWKNNSGGTQIGGVSGVAVNYSDIEGSYTGTSNINVNPIFDPSTLTILPGSPCIDKGDPDPAYYDVCLVPCGPSLGTVTNDIGAHGGPGACGWAAPCLPAIVTPPQNQSSCLGQSAIFTVTATSPTALSYQWHSESGLPTGQTNASLVLTNLQRTNAGQYSVVISNAAGSTNASAQLVVYDACVDIQVAWFFDT